jgi:phosphopantetheine adenylyltransferase
MSDIRKSLGMDVHHVQGPFRVMKPKQAGGVLGGYLDRGIVGRMEDGREVVVGEIWAVGLTENENVRIDSSDLVKRMVDAINKVDDMQKRIEELEEHLEGMRQQIQTIINLSRNSF